MTLRVLPSSGTAIIAKKQNTLQAATSFHFCFPSGSSELGLHHPELRPQEPPPPRTAPTGASTTQNCAHRSLHHPELRPQEPPPPRTAPTGASTTQNCAHRSLHHPELRPQEPPPPRTAPTGAVSPQSCRPRGCQTPGAFSFHCATTWMP
ncbi:ethylene-responsive transcription factor ABI4-like [Lemur catta]|uniref:ethylene-responsive transcription factor ABI4-like n=1 Tax=Lemur catta TaxID=9447 RepID=UPI001E2686D4|nr:ethylene-responsive transcription factor ABI4-like [Lemur catta]